MADGVQAVCLLVKHRTLLCKVRRILLLLLLEIIPLLLHLLLLLLKLEGFKSKMYLDLTDVYSSISCVLLLQLGRQQLGEQWPKRHVGQHQY